MNILDIFRRAHAYKNLPPAARAFLRWVDSQVAALIAAGAVAVGWAFLADNGHMTWASLWHVFLVAVITAALMAIKKYFSAMGDPALSEVAEAGVKKVEGVGQVSADEDARIASVMAEAPAPQKEPGIG